MNAPIVSVIYNTETINPANNAAHGRFRLADHLHKTKDQSLEVMHDLSRGTMAEHAQQFMEEAQFYAPDDPKSRTLRHVVFTIQSDLTDAQVGASLRRYEQAHGISEDQPRFIVAHGKDHISGEKRDQHFHILYAHYNPHTLKALKDSGSFMKNEAASLMVAHDLRLPQEKITKENALVLAEKILGVKIENRPEIGGSIKDEKGSPLEKKSRNRISEKLAETWTRSNSLEDFFQKSSQIGITFVQGERAVLALDKSTNTTIPLLRAINKHLPKDQQIRKNALDALENLKLKSVKEEKTANTAEINQKIQSENRVEREVFSTASMLEIKKLDEKKIEITLVKNLNADNSAQIQRQMLILGYRRETVLKRVANALRQRNRTLRANLKAQVKSLSKVLPPLLHKILSSAWNPNHKDTLSAAQKMLKVRHHKMTVQQHQKPASRRDGPSR